MIAKRSVLFQIMRVAGLFFMGLVVAVVVAFSQINLETLRGDVVNVLRESTGLPIEIDGAVARNHVLPWVRALSLRFGEAKKRP